jgi:hypothetical protein
VNWQWLVLPAASLAVTVTVVVPTGNIEPDAMSVVTVGVEQLSVAVGVGKLTAIDVAVLLSGNVTVMFDGQLITGVIAGLSLTVTVCVPVVELPDASVAVYVITVVPVGNRKFAGTPVREILTAEQLSVADATPSSSSSTTEHELVDVTIGPGTLSVGGVLSAVVVT